MFYRSRAHESSEFSYARTIPFHLLDEMSAMLWLALRRKPPQLSSSYA